MENQNNHEYGQTDPDYIDQNTLVDGNYIQNEDQFHKKEITKDQKSDFGDIDPDFVDQNTPVDNDNYARPEDPYEYKEGFIEDHKDPEANLENYGNTESKSTPDEEQNTNKDVKNATDDKKNNDNSDK